MKLDPQDIDEGSGQGPSGYQGPRPSEGEEVVINLAIKNVSVWSRSSISLKIMKDLKVLLKILETPANPNSCAY